MITMHRVLTTTARLQPCAASARRSIVRRASSQPVEQPDVQKLAQLAHISITPEEAADWQGKIGSVIDWFGQLQAVDVEGVAPASRPAFGAGDADGLALRADEVHDYEGAEGLLAQAPARDGDFVKVPRIVTGQEP